MPTITFWGRFVAIAGRMFFIYCGAMYYLPKYRRKRRELDELITEGEDGKAQR